ncbi:glycerophosphodiester phosphodiesterase family protein [Aneurinibacillus terranovensis]|uniref:glycerophosphodiester phosphodiesterase family protein n=1 Tax=Aneurinibacillus terranovensis TaxID=278991 RepID=UPI00041B912C|nr:glycerophosphodiester phosphodiesterase family protein [Aneurinibacillus terranovensis]
MKDVFITYAHRGSSIKYPENTLLAFSRAIKEGANGIELDVQLTKDNQVVVFHDLSLKRIIRRTGQISNYTLKEIQQFDAGVWKHARFKGAKIPTLHEVLRLAAKQKIMINIELKNLLAMKNGLEQRVIELIKEHNMSDRVVISTFNPLSLRILQNQADHIQRAFLYLGLLSDPWEYALEYRCAYIHPPVHEVNEAFVTTSREKGLKIVPYQVDSLTEIKRMIDLGVDGVITPHPRLVHRLLNAGIKKRKRPRP